MNNTGAFLRIMPKLHASNWFLGWRLQHRPLSFPWASVNVTCWQAWQGAYEHGSRGNWKLAISTNTISETVTDMAKGQNLIHIGFLWGRRQPHEETCAAAAWNMAGTYDTVALYCRLLHLRVFPLRWLPALFFSLPASHARLSKSLLLPCSFPLLLVLTSDLMGSLQLDRKQTQKWILNWIVRNWLF